MNPEVQPDKGAPTQPNLISQLIDRVRDAQLAPGVKADNPATWIHQSHFSARNYQEGEGLVNWDLASDPGRPTQMIRTYLLQHSPTQPRTDMLRDTDRIARMILDIAVDGIDQPITIRRGENGEVFVVGGHTRLFCAINSGKQFVPCQIEREEHTSTETQTLIQQMKSNLFRKEINPRDRGKAYLQILQAATRDANRELTLDEAVELLHYQLDCSREDAEKYLYVSSRLTQDVCDLLANGMIDLDRAASIALSIEDPQEQINAATAFIAKDGTDAQIIQRYKLREVASKGGEGEQPTPQKPPVKGADKNKLVFNLGAIKVQVSSKEELSPERQIAVFESILRSLRKK